MMPDFRCAVLYRIAVVTEITFKGSQSGEQGRWDRVEIPREGARQESLEGASPVQLAGVAFSYLRWLAASVSSAILRLK